MSGLQKEYAIQCKGLGDKTYQSLYNGFKPQTMKYGSTDTNQIAAVNRVYLKDSL